MYDAFCLKKILFNIRDLKQEVDSQIKIVQWQENKVSGLEFKGLKNGRYHSGEHGTKWCYIYLSTELIDKLEESIGCPIGRDVFYLWDYGSVKNLPIHIDSAEINNNKVVAVSLPLIGRFHLRFYSDLEATQCVGECVYGPGDLVLLNNRKYYHEGFVLDNTRLGVHFFLDFESYNLDDTLACLLEKNRLPNKLLR